MLEHGGKLREAAARFGNHDWLDLSTGVNPRGYPAPPLSADIWHRLPETDPALASAASQFYGAPAVLPVAGSQAAIAALPRLRPPGRVTVAAPSYAEHAHHWSGHGHAMREVDYASLEQAVDQSDVLVLCNPNNPTGDTVPAEVLLDWAARLARRGGWLVVDEAFADTDGSHSVACHTGRPGLIVLRSIGKFFGLAGLRLGFVAAADPLLAQLAAMLGPWTISAAASRIGIAALRDHAWQAAMRATLAADGARLRALLATHGIAASGTDLFQWWPEPHAVAFWRHMAERGIWIRLFEHGARGVRLGLPGDEAAWRRLAEALAQHSPSPLSTD